MCLKGTVCSGKGQAAKFIELPWVRKQIAEKLGFTPHPGTLNLRLISEANENAILLKKGNAIEILPAKGFHRGWCFKASLSEDFPCAIIMPDVSGRPEDMVEIIAPVNLRRALQLGNGDFAEIEIGFE